MTRAGATALVTVNLILVAIVVVGFFVSDVGYDWGIFVEAGRRVMTGGLYDWNGYYAWSYSPILAYLFSAVAPIGFWGWTALHVAAVGALPDRWLALVTLASFPFWADVYNGNTMTFVFVAGVWAIRRHPLGIGTYVVMCFLMPRPVMLPLLAWILWKEPRWRIGTLVIAAMNAALLIASSYGPEWISALMTVTDAVADTSRDIGPAALIGPWWVVLGPILAVFLMTRGRVGLASLAAAPYWLPQYLIMMLLELVDRGSAPRLPALAVRLGRRRDQESE